jgi:hypothetical protein
MPYPTLPGVNPEQSVCLTRLHQPSSMGVLVFAAEIAVEFSVERDNVEAFVCICTAGRRAWAFRREANPVRVGFNPISSGTI